MQDAVVAEVTASRRPLEVRLLELRDLLAASVDTASNKAAYAALGEAHVQGTSSPASSGGDSSTWATVKEAAEFFECTEWFIRERAKEMAAAGFSEHPIKLGGWRIDIPAMQAYLAARTAASAKESRFVGSKNRPRVDTDPHETWEWHPDVT